MRNGVPKFESSRLRGEARIEKTTTYKQTNILLKYWGLANKVFLYWSNEKH